MFHIEAISSEKEANTIREWASILKESHIWSAPYKDVPLPR